MIGGLSTIALAQVGARESGNNGGPDVRRYQAATTLPPGPWPWCAAFVCWCLRYWIADPESARWLRLRVTTPDAWRPKTARAFGLIDWARARPVTVQILPESARARPGDVVVFDFSHTGIVVDDTPHWVRTVEGNTDAGGSREGDGVWQKQRSRALVQVFLRIHPSTAGAGKVG